MSGLSFPLPNDKSDPSMTLGKYPFYHLEYQWVLANFFCALMASAGDPWWLSITNVVGDQPDMCLAHLFGFEQDSHSDFYARQVLLIIQHDIIHIWPTTLPGTSSSCTMAFMK